MTEIIKAENAAIAVAETKTLQQQWREHYGAKLTDSEFALFISTAQRLGLEPGRQLFAVKRKDGGEEKMVLQTGIDGYRAIAARTGELDGCDAPQWCGEDGIWREVWSAKTPPHAAKVVVYRKGCAHPFAAVVNYREYKQTKHNGEVNAMWERMPANQLAKCAEAAALRKAFPSTIDGVYIDEEMDQADNVRGAEELADLLRAMEAAKDEAELAAISKALKPNVLSDAQHQQARAAYIAKRASFQKALT